MLSVVLLTVLAPQKSEIFGVAPFCHQIFKRFYDTKLSDTLLGALDLIANIRHG
jgi:hypothetical protein